MKLAEFFKYIAYGELSQLAIGNSNQGEIALSDYPKLISHINLGLTQLHTRLPIRHNEVFLIANEGNQRYRLHTDHLTDNATSNEPKYLQHADLPFTDNLLRIEQVFQYNGDEVPLNDETAKFSAFTPRSDVLQFSQPISEVLSVLYRADHVRLPMKAGLDITSLNLDIPDVCIEPLLNYVTNRVLGSQSSSDALNNAAGYAIKFEQQLQQLERSGLWQTEMPTNLRLEKNGWV